jgi:hypothetical protein
VEEHEEGAYTQETQVQSMHGKACCREGLKGGAYNILVGFLQARKKELLLLKGVCHLFCALAGVLPEGE